MKRKWPQEHDAALASLHGQGLSFAQIAGELFIQFKVSYSRNACIGRALRIGLTRNVMLLTRNRAASASQREDAKRERRDSADLPVRRGRRRYKLKAEFAAAPEGAAETTALRAIRRRTIPVGSIASRTIHAIRASERGTALLPDTRPMRCAEITPRHLNLMDLDRNTCRWPHGGFPEATPITFCGHWTPEDAPYCEAHQQLAVGRGTFSERAASRLPAKA